MFEYFPFIAIPLALFILGAAVAATGNPTAGLPVMWTAIAPLAAIGIIVLFIWGIIKVVKAISRWFRTH